MANSNENGNISMDDESKNFLGVTAPLSIKPPTDIDLNQNQQLLEAVRQLDIFETDEGRRQRAYALIALEEEARTWIRDVTEEQALPEHIVAAVGGKIYTFGSYRLGVNTKGADVDALLVAPCFVSRDDFFNSFYALLQDNPDVEDIHTVPDAFVPVMKMKYKTIEIDLLFASIDRQSIPDDLNLCKDTDLLLSNLDERTVRSLNGVRVTEEMLSLVPSPEVFKSSLKVIRTWAKNKGLYSNVLGFLGGVSWAILVARVCQLFPKACTSVIVQKFFFVLAKWEWPRPIQLKKTEEYPNLGLISWDPRTHVQDGWHLMPIITPAYPAQNSTYNVTLSTRQIIKREIEGAMEVVKEINFKRKEWSDLFTPSAFFTLYRHYVVVLVESDRRDCFLEFSGLVESKIRLLVQNLERNPFVELAHVNCHSFGKASASEKEFVRKWFVGLQFRKAKEITQPDGTVTKEAMNIELTYEIHSFVRTIERLDATTTTNLFGGGSRIDVKYTKRSALNKYLSKEDQAAHLSNLGHHRRKRNSLSSSRRDSVEGTSTGSPSTSNLAEKRKCDEEGDGSAPSSPSSKPSLAPMEQQSSSADSAANGEVSQPAAKRRVSYEVSASPDSCSSSTTHTVATTTTTVTEKEENDDSAEEERSQTMPLSAVSMETERPNGGSNSAECESSNV